MVSLGLARWPLRKQTGHLLYDLEGQSPISGTHGKMKKKRTKDQKVSFWTLHINSIQKYRSHTHILHAETHSHAHMSSHDDIWNFMMNCLWWGIMVCLLFTFLWKNKVNFASLPKFAEVEDTIINFISIGYVIWFLFWVKGTGRIFPFPPLPLSCTIRFSFKYKRILIIALFSSFLLKNASVSEESTFS